MKIINKIKNFIFDPEEEKLEKIEKREHKEVIEKEQEKKKELIDDIIDDNDDYKNIPPKKRFDFDRDFFPETRVKEEPSKEILYTAPSYRKDSKKFKPSPMISPVFGLISVASDEEKKEKKIKEEKNINPFDAVRQKAYGTLTDEIEDTLTRLNKGNFYKPPKSSEKEVIYKEETIEIKTKVDNEKTKEYENFDEGKEKIKFETIDVEKEFIKDKDDDDEDTKESDLFNLIETMYEGSEDKE